MKTTRSKVAYFTKNVETYGTGLGAKMAKKAEFCTTTPKAFQCRTGYLDWGVAVCLCTCTAGSRAKVNYANSNAKSNLKVRRSQERIGMAGI